MDMVKKVARAIYEALKVHSWGEYVGEQGDGHVQGMTVLDGDFDLTAAARAAIEAMREPTEEMLDAKAVREVWASEFRGDLIFVRADKVIWEAMIDAALKATPTSE